MSHTLNITGPVPDAEIKRILLGLCAELHVRHAAARAHGGLCPDTVAVDDDGSVHLLAASDSRQDGYAAFECYADDPAWPIGTWTDMYALGAIGHALMLGYPPAHAIARQRQPGRRVFGDAAMSETPLGRAITHALALVPATRTQNVMQFLHDAGWPMDVLAAVATGSLSELPDVQALPVREGRALPVHEAQVQRADEATVKALPETARDGLTDPIVVPVVRPVAEPDTARSPALSSSGADAGAKSDAKSGAKSDAKSDAGTADQPAPQELAHAPDASSNRMPLTGMVAIALLFLIAGSLWWFNRESAPAVPAQQAAANTGAGGATAGAAGTPGTGTGANGSARGGPGSDNRTPPADGATGSPAAPSPVPETVPEPPALPGYGPTSPTATSPATATPSPTSTSPASGTSSVTPTSPAAGTSPATATLPATTTPPDAAGGTSSANPATASSGAAASGSAGASSAGQAATPSNGASGSVAGVSAGAAGSTSASEGGSATSTASGSSQGATEGQSGDTRAGTTPGSASAPTRSDGAGETGERASTAATSSTENQPATAPEPEVPAVRNSPVSVSVQPWGEVFINGASRGVSPPLQSLTLAPGTYRVTIQNPNAEPYHTRVTVIAGQPARIQHTFR